MATNQSLSDIPTIIGYGSHSGQLLGDHAAPEERETDFRQSVDRWRALRQSSSRFLGLRSVPGANHLSLVTYRGYASDSAAMAFELVERVRFDRAKRSSD